MAKIPRRVQQAGVYFVTADTWERHALFINSQLANIAVEQIVSCRDRGSYKLHAFALMPEHLHILLTPSDETSIERAMQMIKGGSSHRIGVEKPQAFPVWHRSFHDRWIRDAEQFWQAKSYRTESGKSETRGNSGTIRVVFSEWEDIVGLQLFRRASG